MGHFRLSFVRQGTIPKDTKLSVRMSRTVEPGVEPTTECKPTFDGWLITTVPESLTEVALASDWQVVITPADGTDTCGKCLEWAAAAPLQLFGASGAEPEITSVEAAEDCVGMVATIAGQSPPPEQWELIFHASLEGQPFGRESSLVISITPPPQHTWSGDIQAPQQDDAQFYPLAQDLWGVLLVFENILDENLFSWGVSEPNGNPGNIVLLQDLGYDSFAKTMTYSVSFQFLGGDRPEDFDYVASFDVVYDGVPYQQLTLAEGV